MEARPLYGGDWQWSAPSCCCHGGVPEGWLTLVDNSSFLHSVPVCEGHLELPKQAPSFDMGNQNEYQVVTGHRPGPSPTFRCLWRDILSFRWKAPQHGNILELSAFITELCRRARDPKVHGRRFFCSIDSLVTFFLLAMCRSSSRRLNRVCRRLTAVRLASGIIPMPLWMFSKCNYSDDSSRKMEPARSSSFSGDH